MGRKGSERRPTVIYWLVVANGCKEGYRPCLLRKTFWLAREQFRHHASRSSLPSSTPWQLQREEQPPGKTGVTFRIFPQHEEW